MAICLKFCLILLRIKLVDLVVRTKGPVSVIAEASRRKLECCYLSFSEAPIVGNEMRLAQLKDKATLFSRNVLKW